MADWVRNAVMLGTLAVWAIAIGVYLYRGQLPDAPILGVPGAIYLALNPPMLPSRRKRDSAEAP